MVKMEDLVNKLKDHIDGKFKSLETQITNLKTQLNHIEIDNVFSKARMRSKSTW